MKVCLTCAIIWFQGRSTVFYMTLSKLWDRRDLDKSDNYFTCNSCTRKSVRFYPQSRFRRCLFHVLARTAFGNWHMPLLLKAIRCRHKLYNYWNPFTNTSHISLDLIEIYVLSYDGTLINSGNSRTVIHTQRHISSICPICINCYPFYSTAGIVFLRHSMKQLTNTILR